MKTAFKSAFVDTALFIYLLEDQPAFAESTERFLNFCYTNQINLVTSILTYSEFCVKPYREHQLDLIHKYNEMIHLSGFLVSTVTLLDCDQAAKLRAKYPGLKAFDALQIALALKEKCEIFACNDKRLKTVNEIQVMTLDELGKPSVTEQVEPEQAA